MRLRDYLHSHDVKQKDLAEQVGISESHLSNIARGNATPSLAVAIAIEKATAGQVTLSDWVEIGGAA